MYISTKTLIMRLILTSLLLISLCSLKMSAQGIPSYVSPIGLQGWWPFSGNANDLSGNGHNGTVTSALLSPDRFGQALSAYAFNGNAHVSFTNNTNLNITGDLSISVWIKPKVGNAGGQAVWFGDNSGAADPYSIVLAPNYQVYFRRDGGGGSITDVVTGTYTLTPDSSYHVVAAYSSSLNILQLYINGVLNNTTSVTAPIAYSTSGMYLNFGALENGLAMFIKATLDDIGIWSRTLSACEVLRLYRTPKFSASTNRSSICAGQSATLSAAGAPSYSWSPGGTTASVIITPTQSTVYTVSTTYNAGCNDSKTVSVSVSPCTSLEEDATQDWSVYPNPAESFFEMHVPEVHIGKNYSIFNSKGQLIMQELVPASLFKLDVAEWAPDFYYITMNGWAKPVKLIILSH
jgi:hypothetical protein